MTDALSLTNRQRGPVIQRGIYMPRKHAFTFRNIFLKYQMVNLNWLRERDPEGRFISRDRANRITVAGSDGLPQFRYSFEVGFWYPSPVIDYDA